MWGKNLENIFRYNWNLEINLNTNMYVYNFMYTSKLYIFSRITYVWADGASGKYTSITVTDVKVEYMLPILYKYSYQMW